MHRSSSFAVRGPRSPRQLRTPGTPDRPRSSNRPLSLRALPIRAGAALALLALFSLTEAAETRAATIAVEPGAVRELEARRARPVAVRLSNRGDCSVGVVARDENGVVSLRTELLPGETRDFLTPSARIRRATLIARSEGSGGAIIDLSPIETGQIVRLPNTGPGIPCVFPGRTIYISEDGEAAPEVTYWIQNESRSDCVLQVTLFEPNQPAPTVERIESGDSLRFRGVFREIVLNGLGADEATFSARFRRE